MGYDCQVTLDDYEEQKKDSGNQTKCISDNLFRDTRVKKDCPDYENWKSYFFKGGYFPYEPGGHYPIIFTINN